MSSVSLSGIQKKMLKFFFNSFSAQDLSFEKSRISRNGNACKFNLVMSKVGRPSGRILLLSPGL